MSASTVYGVGDALGAGAVTVQVKNGTLVLTGDGGGNAVRITQPGDWQVAPDDGSTAINGVVGPATFTVTRGIRADLRGGANALVVDDVDVTGPIDLRYDSLGALTIAASSVDGDVSVRGGNGMDAISVGGSFITGSLSLRAGDGGSSVSVGGSMVAKDLKVDSRDGFDALNVSGANLAGRTMLKYGNGGSGVGVIGSLLAGGLEVQSREGFDNVTVTDAGIGGVDLKLGDGGSSAAFGGSGTTIEGNLRMRSQDGHDVLNLDTVHVAGNLQMASKHGGAVATLYVQVDGNVQLKHGNESSVMTDFRGGASAVVRGKTQIRSGVAPATFLCGSSGSMLFLGDVKVRAKDGFAAASVGPCGFERDLSFDAGKGGGVFDLAGGGASIVIGENLSLTSKTGSFTTVLQGLLVEGKTTIRSTGASIQVVDIDDVDLAGPVSIKTGKGNDLVFIETEVTAAVVESLFEDKVAISTGAGDDVLIVGDTGLSSDAEFLGPITYDGGKGSDTLDHLSYDNVYAVPPKLKGIESEL